MDPTVDDSMDVYDLPLGGGTADSSFDSVYSADGDTIVDPVAQANGTPGDAPAPAAGSIIPPSSTSAAGGSGAGTWLSGLASLATAGASIFKAVNGPTVYGVNTAGQSCTLGTAGCNPVSASSSSQTTMLIMVGLGALVLIIVLRKK